MPQLIRKRTIIQLAILGIASIASPWTESAFGQGMMFSMGGDRGGDRGGGDRGGGMRGGFGGRGGFDPSSMLSRMDGNGNGQLDPEEMQGPARMFLERMAAGNPSIDLSKPIPLATITGEFEKMRGGFGGGGGGSFGGGGGGWFGGGDSEEAAPEIRQLVKGFGDDKKPDVPLGFGPKAEVNAVKVEARDLSEAEERIRRYDRNRDQALDEEELKSGRWSDSPLQYDRNGDKKLTKEELSVRYARVRLAGGSNGGGDRNGGDRGDRRGGMMSMFGGGGVGGNGGGGNAEDKDKDKGKEKEEERRVSSFRGMAESKKTAGAPAWFLDSDANKDSQVSMAEFASKLDEEKLEEYMKFDTNGDGFITVKEVLLAVKNGVLRNSVAAKTASASGPSTSTSAAAANSNVSMEGLPADADPKWVDFCRKRIEKIDKNKNGTVSFDEWTASMGDFTKYDGNGDGIITLAEYLAQYMASKKS